MTDPSMSRPIIHQRSPHSFVNTFGSFSFATETAPTVRPAARRPSRRALRPPAHLAGAGSPQFVRRGRGPRLMAAIVPQLMRGKSCAKDSRLSIFAVAWKRFQCYFPRPPTGRLGTKGGGAELQT